LNTPEASCADREWRVPIDVSDREVSKNVTSGRPTDTRSADLAHAREGGGLRSWVRPHALAAQCGEGALARRERIARAHRVHDLANRFDDQVRLILLSDRPAMIGMLRIRSLPSDPDRLTGRAVEERSRLRR